MFLQFLQFINKIKSQIVIKIKIKLGADWTQRSGISRCPAGWQLIVRASSTERDEEKLYLTYPACEVHWINADEK